MAEQKVELRKTRDFGENLNDTILFIRQNLKSLLTCFLGSAGIFMLTFHILSSIYQGQFSAVFTNVLSRRGANGIGLFSLFSTTYFVAILFGWLNFIAMEVSVISYLKVYEIKNGDTPEFSEVWKVFRRYFFKIFLYSIPIGLLSSIGMVFCFVPGIYLIMVFIPFASIIIIEGKTFGGAFNRCFNLVKDNFWISVAIYLVSYLISWFGSQVISWLELGANRLVSSVTTREPGIAGVPLTSILNIVGMVFFILYFVSVTLHYFNLVEKLDGTGMMQKLDSIGGRDHDFENINEQF